MDIYQDALVKLAAILGLNIKKNDLNEKSIEEILHEAEVIKKDDEMLNMAIDNCVDSFHIADGKGIILRVNRAFENHTKRGRTAIEGKSVQDMVKAHLYQPSAVLIAIKEKRKVTMLQSGPDGEVIATASPVLDENSEVKLVVSNARFTSELKLLEKYYDIKEKKKKEELKIIGSNSPVMKKLLSLAAQVAISDSSVLIMGETGSGKSLLAKHIHEKSKRKNENFVEINCAAIPESLMESELFGYSSGAFTGAKKGGKPGLIELADKGTLFLDEIGDMPINLQAKLLQVLQNRSITRIGGEESVPVDIRLISATNMDLVDMIANGQFRKELYYRINVVPLFVPSLRERKEDIPVLIHTFLDKISNENNMSVDISEAALERLINYKWPGNVRELSNVIERLIVTNNSQLIELKDLPNNILLMTDELTEDIIVNRIIPLKEALEAVERELILSAYDAYGNSYKVAKALEISQSGASRKYIKYKKMQKPSNKL